MEDDFNLYKLIIKSVEQQISENNPPATKKTFERLVKNGCDKETAKEMIASLIAEEIYLMLKDNRKITEDDYAARLDELE